MNPKRLSLEFLRIANPWMVSSNVQRVVPVYLLHNVAMAVIPRANNLQSIKDLTQDVSFARDEGMTFDFRSSTDSEIRRLCYGLFAPERRVFRRAQGGASRQGALFPLHGSMCERQISDDQLGIRLQQLLDASGFEWRSNIFGLLCPEEAFDAATQFAKTLVGDSEEQNADLEARAKQNIGGYDRRLAKFICNLIPTIHDARRITAIRDLAIGLQFASILRLVNGPLCEDGDRPPGFMCFPGLPPGDSHDPLVHACSFAMSQLMRESRKRMAAQIQQDLDAQTPISGSSGGELLSQKIVLSLRNHFSDTTSSPSKAELASFADDLSSEAQNNASSTWILSAMDRTPLDFSHAKWLLRIRNLGKTIGFCAPEKGVGEPRFVLDTPLLSVVVRGVLGTHEGTLEFRSFVTRLRNDYGLIVGIGEDDSFIAELSKRNKSGVSTDELLERSEEILRQRLLSIGLARSYSDSHTEVISHGY